MTRAGFSTTPLAITEITLGVKMPLGNSDSL
jgi:hypothetical protein